MLFFSQAALKPFFRACISSGDENKSGSNDNIVALRMIMQLALLQQVFIL